MHTKRLLVVISHLFYRFSYESETREQNSINNEDHTKEAEDSYKDAKKGKNVETQLDRPLQSETLTTKVKSGCTPKKVKSSSTPKSRKSSLRKKLSIQKSENRMLELAFIGEDKLKYMKQTVTIPMKWRQEDIMVALQKIVR